MSNLQQQQRPLSSEEQFDPNAFNFKGFLQQNPSISSFQTNFNDLDSQYQMQQQFTGRFTQQNDQQRGYPQQQPSYQDFAKTNFLNQPPYQISMQQPKLTDSQGSTQYLGREGIEDFNSQAMNLNKMPLNQDQTNLTYNPSSFAEQQQKLSMLLGAGNSSQQQQLLMLELLKMQQPPSQMPSFQNQNQPPAFGAGFLGAAQLLATSSQFNQNSQPSLSNQISQQSLQDKQNQPLQPLQPPQSSYFQNMNNIYSNLNHYQSLIESIEKQNAPISQQFPIRPQGQTSAPQAQPYSYQQQFSQSMAGDLPSQFSVPQPKTSKQSMIYEPQQNFQKDFEQETQRSGLVSQDQVKKYNPGAYSNLTSNPNRSFSQEQFNQKPAPQQKQPSYAALNSRQEDLFTSAEAFSQRSPPRNQNDFRGRENYSPSQQQQNSAFRFPSQHGLNDIQNESLSLLNQAQNQKLSSHGSPPRSGGRHNYGIDYLDQSSNRNGGNNHFQISNHNNSQGSILQEQQMNTMTNRQQNNQYQYSPTGSSYNRNGDDGENFNANNSISFKPQSHRSGAVNIDDIPIHTTKARNFEELLEKNLKQLGIDGAEEDNEAEQMYNQNSSRHQKKEFLKRKSKKTSVSAVPAKKYNYYVDNFEDSKEKEKAVEKEREKIQQQQENAMKRKERPPVHQSSESHKVETQKNPPQEASAPPLARSQSEAPIEKSSKSATKKPFLARGSGTAGGRKGLEAPQSIPKEEQKQKSDKQAKKHHPALMSDEEGEQLFSEQDNKSPRPSQNQQLGSYLNKLPPKQTPNSTQHATQAQHLAQQKSQLQSENAQTRNSILEFEKLEQECIEKYSPNTVAQTSKQVNVKKRKKLFDDSDSDHNGDDEPNYDGGSQSAQNEEEVQKSNVVKKFFYKDEKQPVSKPNPATVQNTSISSNGQVLTDQMQQIVNQKLEQLDEAIEKYNQENDRVSKMKKEYEGLLKKTRVEYRDLEAKRKKDLEDLEKFKAEERDKVAKERKALEQRTKNLQLVNTSSKKEREEIDALKKELARVSEEAKAKEQKSKLAMDRLKKQVDDLTARNKEMQDEIRTLEMARVQQTQVQSQIGKGALKMESKLQPPSSRYTFSQNANEEAAMQQSDKQPKGILKNKNEVVSQQQRVYPDTQHSDDEEDDCGEDQDQDLQQDDDHVDEDEEQQRFEEEQAFLRQQQQIKAQQQIAQQQQQLKQQQEALQKQQQEKLLQQQKQIEFEQQQRLLQEQQQKQAQQQQQTQNQQHQQQRKNESMAEEDEEDYDMKFPKDYHNKTPSNMKVIEQIIGHDGKIQRVYENGKKEVIFNNGVKREVFPDGYTIVYFNNNDIKQTYSDQKVVYYFAEAKTTQTTFPDGLQVFKFANNQIEKHFPDGTKEIIFPDGTIKCIFTDGEEESIFPDGTIQRIEKSGVKAIEFANGQKDILFPDGTRIREFPDGRVRKTFPDGTFENTFRQ